MIIDDFKIALEELRKRYNNFEVSAFIGAGFSKNVSSEFPSWNELLFDMVEELYKSEIDREFNNILIINPNREINYDDFKKDKVLEIINRDGYLSIVSKFKEKKGYREAIESYIEERIPFVFEDKKCLFISKNNKERELQDDVLKLHKTLLECTWDTIYTTNYDTLIENTAEKYEKSWTVIENAYEISFKDLTSKHIIKLHGTFKDSPERKSNFEFDGCHWHRYIISQEDYLNYPIDHEAFTQLMRITLLKGTFCLFGFSGDDPNFIGWISWVRDILVKSRVNSSNGDKSKEQIKIFLVTIDDKLPSKDRALFYYNHNIQLIPLLHPEVKDIISATEKDDIKELHLKFLDYINYSHSISYGKLWGDFDINFNKVKTDEKKSEVIVQIQGLKPENRIVSECQWQKVILDQNYSNDSFDVVDKSIFIAALQDTYLYPQYYPNLIDKISKNNDIPQSLKYTFDLLSERYNTLTLLSTDCTVKNDAFKFEKLLYCAFSLDFKTLAIFFNEWQTLGVWGQKKAMFLALFDMEKSKDLLLNCLDTETNLKESYYITDLLNIVNQTYPKEYSTVNYENQNLSGLYALRDNFSSNLSNAIERDKDKIKSYDDTSTTYHLGRNNQVFYHAFRYLQFLIDSGLPPRIGFWNIIDSEEWYKIFNGIFKYFPFPVLFYSLFLSDKKLLKRIGQDYAYEESLCNNECNLILSKLLNCILCDSTPKIFSNSIIVIAQELFVVVPTTKWECKFLEIWTNKVLPNYSSLMDTKDEDLFGFASKGLSYMKKDENISKIIIDCLENRKNNYSATINLFVELPKQFKNKKNRNVLLGDKIDAFLEEIDHVEELVIAGNLFTLLSFRNISVLNEKMKNLITVHSDIQDHILFSSAYYADKLNKTLIKTAVINHPRLWDNGLSGRMSYILVSIKDSEQSVTPPDYIPLSKFYNRLRWTRGEVFSIYSRLRISFLQLKNNNYFNADKVSPFIRYEGLLNEMYLFLCNYEKSLEKADEFSKIFEQVRIQLYVKRKFISIDEALMSNDADILVRGLNELRYNVLKKGISDYLWIAQNLLVRIILQQSCRLAYCLDTALFFVDKYWSDVNLDQRFKLLYIQILQIYDIKKLKDLNADVYSCYHSLISISDILHKYGIESEHIAKWQKIKKQKRFN